MIVRLTRPMPVTTVNIIMIVIMVLLVAWQVIRSDGVGDANRYRSMKVERHRLASLLDILKSNQSVVVAAKSRQESVESLTISILEAIKAAAVNDALVIHQLAVTQSEAQAPSALASILSVQVSLSVHRAMNLLMVFDAIREVASWRAFEIRGCELAREQKDADSATPGLHAACRIDVYYYPSLLP